MNFVSNFTDVDDKIIKKAIEEGVSPEEVSGRYIEECKKDMAGTVSYTHLLEREKGSCSFILRQKLLPEPLLRMPLRF